MNGNFFDQTLDVFSGFSNIWSSGSWGEMSAIFWPLNAIACAIIVFEAFALMHLSHSRWKRLAYAMISFGAFAYLIGQLNGKYSIVAPVEAIFHWSIVFGLAASIWRQVFLELHYFGRNESASSSERAQVGKTSGRATEQYSKKPSSGRQAARR